jgi:hypothetical protein
MHRSRNAGLVLLHRMKQHEVLPLITISRDESAWFHGKRCLDAIGSW